MNLALVEQIAKAVLYEGYMLYPYRPSSVKNRQRFNFGVLYPQAYSDAQEGQDPASLRTECLICGNENATLEVRLRFLQLQVSALTSPSERAPVLPDGWQEATERDFAVNSLTLAELCRQTRASRFAFPDAAKVDPGIGSESPGDGAVRHQETIEGVIEIRAERLREGLFKIFVHVRNTTPLDRPDSTRDEALMRSLVSAHLVLGVEGAEFVSLLEPPDDLRDLAAQCQNVGAWPVLVGDPGQRDTLLASPIILYDYPQIAPESAGDLFDGTEIDEILSLRIMTLTDEEKQEIRSSDERARQILERTENMPAEQFMKLHGAVRGMRPLPPPKEDIA